jgi:serine/threonine protein kinase/WD40 repeat protein
MNDENFVERLATYDEAAGRGDSRDGLGDDDARLAEAFDCVELLNRVWPRTNADAGVASAQAAIDALGDTVDGVSGVDLHDTLIAAPEGHREIVDGASETPQRIGRFQIVRLLGQGGSGIVFLARDVELGRHVALKVPRPETLLTPELRRRFLQEARAAAALSHPGIVPVYDAGSIGPVCYIASEFCAGPTLAQWLSQHGGVSFHLAAEWVALLADAVEHAHQRGVLHRDLKPGNILLAQQDSAAATNRRTDNLVCSEQAEDRQDCLSYMAPRITDFGLAKLQSSDATATRTGSMLGTAAYMAPEQVEGRTSAIDRGTDVYGLGAILFELITGQPPFREATDIATLVAVRQRDPARPSELRAGLPPDLEAICLTCLEKDPNKRYSTAANLAGDLRRFLAGEPTLVRPLGPLKRSIKWVARHRLLSALIAVVAISLLLFMAGSAWHAYRLRRELATSDRLRLRAEEREASYRDVLYAADMRLANQALLDNDMPRAVELLDAHIPAAGEEDNRDFEWYLLRRQAVGEHTVLDDVGTPTYDLAFAPDDSRLATVGKDSRLRVYEWPSGKLLSVIDTGQKGNRGLAFSEDSATIATAGEDGTIKFWDGSKPVRTIQAHAGRTNGVVYSKGIQHWISWGDEPDMRIWDPRTGTPSGVLSGHIQSVTSVATPWGNKDILASVGRDQTLRLWDPEARKEMLSRKLPSRGTCLVFSGQDEALVVGTIHGHVARWQTGTWDTPLPAITPVHTASSVAFSPDGFRLAIGNRLGAIWIWRPVRGKPDRAEVPLFLCTLKAHSGAVTEVLYDSKSNYLLSVGEDGKLIRWPAVEEGKIHRLYDDYAGDLQSADCFADCPIAAVAGSIGVAVVDVRDGSVVCRLTSEHADWNSVSVARGARAVAASRKNGEVWVWPDWKTSIEKPAIYRVAPGHHPIILSRDGRLLAVVEDASAEGGLMLINLASGRKQDGFTADGCSCASFSSDGILLAVGEHGTNDTMVWNIERHELLHRFDHHPDTVTGLAFSPDSRKLASLDHSAVLTVWDVVTGRQQWSTTSAAGGRKRFSSSVTFTPRGNSIVTKNSLGVMNFWHVASGREMFTLGDSAWNGGSLVFCDRGRYFCGLRSNRLFVFDTGVTAGTR